MASLRTENSSPKGSTPGKQDRRRDSSTSADPADRLIDPDRQGISNRPGDEDPDSGVNREPGPDLTETQKPSR